MIVRARGVLVVRGGGNGDGDMGGTLIETGDEPVVKDEKARRVWGVVFRGIVVFADGEAVKIVAEEGEAVWAVGVVAELGVARVGGVLVGAVVGGGVVEGGGLEMAELVRVEGGGCADVDWLSGGALCVIDVGIVGGVSLEEGHDGDR